MQKVHRRLPKVLLPPKKLESMSSQCVAGWTPHGESFAFDMAFELW